MRLWLVRHAPPLVARGVCYGQSDLSANPTATTACAARLAEALPPHATVWCSPLQRCEQISQILRGLRPDLTPKTDPRLAEMHFGAWEGLPWDAIGQTAVDAWVADFAHHRPGGGESAHQVLHRVGAALDDARASAPPHMVWLTHAGVARAARLWLSGVRDLLSASAWPTAAPAFGTWEVVDA